MNYNTKNERYMTCTILLDIVTRETCKQYGDDSGETENTRQAEEIVYILILLSRYTDGAIHKRTKGIIPRVCNCDKDERSDVYNHRR